MYQLINDPDTNKLRLIKHVAENGFISCIPLNPDNRDYQEYLKWVAEGNTPLPAEE